MSNNVSSMKAIIKEKLRLAEEDLTQINYEKLLKKYMAQVYNYEGVCCIPLEKDDFYTNISDDEFRRLNDLADELREVNLTKERWLND